ncbi:MAG TPA: NAD-dependent epimerase/dehydratase family protein [Geminicoccaceae bacterium]|nr:NAD-dependent epimerase/dehydratase family protein [Geminicoccus sp.]HMU50983.1 NAD-dependent epimerase/dehydratase family protein [Geminicoccaceae bacterium]
MHVFVTGATGYIGGTIAARLLAAGHEVSGLARDPAKAVLLEKRGIVPVAGSLDDLDALGRACRRADAAINAASSDHRAAVEACLDALAGTGKPFLHTSGSSIVADDAEGEPGDAVFDEDTAFTPPPLRVARVVLDRDIRAASARGVRSVVLCNSLIYGRGLGLHEESVQVPSLVALARQRGVASHVGRGLNVWSTVHVEDVADLYLLALEKAPGGSFYFVEHGESSFRDMARAIGRTLGLGERTEPWPIAEAVAAWGEGKARFTMASNSRVRAARARAELGWRPSRPSVIADIESGWYLAARSGTSTHG